MNERNNDDVWGLIGAASNRPGSEEDWEESDGSSTTEQRIILSGAEYDALTLRLKAAEAVVEAARNYLNLPDDASFEEEDTAWADLWDAISSYERSTE